MTQFQGPASANHSSIVSLQEFGDARWVRLAAEIDTPNLYLDAVRDFELTQPVALTLHISAVSQYQVYVNGQFIGRGPAVGDPACSYYHTYQVPVEALRRGRNRVAVRLHHEGRTTETIQLFQYGDPGLLVWLGQVGERALVVSDESWRMRRSTVFSGAMLVSKWGTYKQFYHGTHEDPWVQPEFDASGWATAAAFADPESAEFIRQLHPLPTPELESTTVQPRRIVEFSANLGRIAGMGQDVITTAPMDYCGQVIRVEAGEPYAQPAVTFDFGTIVVGYPELHTAGSACSYELWYGETLDMTRLDVVHAAPSGCWKSYQRRAFRFLQVRFIALPAPTLLESVTLENSWYAYNAAQALTSSDRPEVDRILEISRHTLRANTSYHFEDCPWREQALWIFDMRLMAQINYYHYGNPEVVAKCLRQEFALLREDGSCPSTGPRQNGMFHLDFCLHLIGTLKEYGDYTGDNALVAELWPAVRRLLEFVRTARRPESGLLDSTMTPERGHPFLDWSDKIDKAGQTTILNALYVGTLRDVALLAERAGAPSDEAEAYKTEAERVRATINRLLWDPAEQVYRDTRTEDWRSPKSSFQANLAALWAELPPPDEAQALLSRVLADPVRFPLPFGPSFYYYVFDTLGRMGRHEAIVQQIHDYWGAMLDRGAVTWWEVFDPTTPPWVYPHPFLGNVPTYELDYIPISSCHGWSGAPGSAIPRWLLGVDLAQVHAGRVVINPGLPGYFQRFSYRLPLAGGVLGLEYHGEGGRYRIEVVECPAGIEVVLPA